MSYPWLTPERLALNRAIETGHLGHAPMLLGSVGVGKRDLADWLAARLLCRQPADGNPCRRCDSCRLLTTGTHPDFFRLGVLEDKTEILIDQVRDFIASISLTPSIGSRRVGLITPADKLNNNAANALLKTLEEPAGEVWLLLVTDREDRLPVTVVSRCQRRYVPVPDRAAALEWLADAHGDRSPQQCELALDLADGAPLLADRWLSGAGLEQALAIRDALAAMIGGRVDEMELIEQWQQTPDQTWGWLARFSQAWLGQLLTGQPSCLGLPDDRLGPNASDILQRCWKQALEGRRLAARPVRQDWLMRRWLMDWQRIGI
ncbi:MAG: DNA polymerase III subunit delta' [Wenzhouxiangellaceae bacterium]|nr:DNA polymerase III subunit delta' [Wenzhouxiangellaceae bacterium]